MNIVSVMLSSLFWTKIGAIGSWAGSIFGLAAFLIAIMSLELPNKIRVKTEVSLKNIYDLISNDPKDNNVCSIVIMNSGLRLVNIEQIYVAVGKKGTLFSAGIISDGSSVEKSNNSFPFRIEPGYKEKYFVPLDELLEFVYDSDDSKENKKLYIVIDEATKGKLYFKTDYSIKDLITEKSIGQTSHTEQ